MYFFNLKDVIFFFFFCCICDVGGFADVIGDDEFRPATEGKVEIHLDNLFVFLQAFSCCF